MATVIPPPPAAFTKPTSVQPGGGLCMQLELSWGKLRRSWLRRFRPNYVRRMAELRQGSCPGCPHDIVDPRDLKYYRNVCGYWFRPEDDAFRWRDRLGFARAGLAELLLMSALCGAFYIAVGWLAVALHPICWLPFAIVCLVHLEIVYFFRDPERQVPTETDALVSPADGTVTHVGEIEDADFPGGRAFRISIFLSIFNVHVNRIPRGGKVVDIRYFPGCFLDARHAECGVRNEQLWIDLEEAGTQQPIRVKQIAGKIARRIVCWLKAGEMVQAGTRFGMIKFGSRTDVLLPASRVGDVLVRVGDKVHGGSTVLLRCRNAS